MKEQRPHHGAVRITEHNAGTHINQFVDKKQPAFKHFLVNQHIAFRLCRDHQNDAQ